MDTASLYYHCANLMGLGDLFAPMLIVVVGLILLAPAAMGIRNRARKPSAGSSVE